ncbi:MULTISPECIES: aminotransferase class I/II-fold pyridoxal phosphate-dependent enzyme [unclassified Campylobacter]|uniref:aminotransferase class I/II-fold pyridoxal phosphate-dependent enzyme n=1 Tax=unclassified Campylobacter TaxID=2593542 RepID=UPI003D35945E
MIKKIVDNLFIYPHYKMNIFSGTNTIKDFFGVFGYMLNPKKNDSKDYLIEYKQRIDCKIGTNSFLFASGRMGFYTILKSIDIKPGDEIIVPSFTCVVVINAILYCGAKPVYCDITQTDFNIDILKIEKLITPKTRIIYAQHTFGQMCDIENLLIITKKYSIILIEDAALSLGANKNGKFAGTIGDFGYYSTDRSKVINTGLGGIVSVNNPMFLDKFNQLYSNVENLDYKMVFKISFTFLANLILLHPLVYWIGKIINLVLQKFGFLVYFFDENLRSKDDIKKYPYPAKMPNILAKVGISQIESLSKNIQNRKQKAKFYNNILKFYSEEYMNMPENIFLRYSFLINNRDKWERKFSKVIDLSVWFKSIASGCNDIASLGYKRGQNPVSEYVCEHIFNLPTHDNINCKKIKKLLMELKNSGDIITSKYII